MNALGDSANTDRCTLYEDSVKSVKRLTLYEDRISDLSKPLKGERRGHTKHNVS